LFFEPENVANLTEKVKFLNSNRDKLIEFGNNGRNYVNDFFNRDKLAKSFFNELQKLA